MFWTFILMAFVFGCLLAGCVFWWVGRKRESPVKPKPKRKIDITVLDILRLASLSTTLDVTALIMEYRIHIKNPEFYERYQALNKRERELYFDQLIIIFSRNHPENIARWYQKYPNLSTQDMLLLIMSSLELDNKTMAQILVLSPETLKKRKTRLKAKIGMDLPSAKVDIDI